MNCESSGQGLKRKQELAGLPELRQKTQVVEKVDEGCAGNGQAFNSMLFL